MQIVETSDNHLFRVTDVPGGDHPHLWLGVPVKKVRGEYVERAKAKPVTVRRAGCRIVAKT